MKIEIKTQKYYDIFIDENIDFNEYISKIYQNKNIFIIIDENVKNIYLEKITNNLKKYNLKVISIQSSEDNKTITTYENVINELLNNNITRDSLILGIGGGVVGDIAAFVAATILRGVKYISIPTTLLSQVDSSIGGKTGLNFNNRKNMIGTFTQPDLVLIDTCFLNTLSKEEFNNGLGEVIKCAFIKDKEILSLLKDKTEIKQIIYKCLNVKKHFVEKDIYDKNERMILNFGHTFGHVIELENKIKHGFAVIKGMILAIKYSIDLNLCDNNVLTELYSTLDSLNIDYTDLDYNEYFSKLNNDKKNDEECINFILLNDIEKPIIKKIKRI